MKTEIWKLITGDDPDLMLSAAKECGIKFWSQVCLCVLVSEDLFYEVYDMCEEKGMIRFKNKKLLNACQKSFGKLDSWLAGNGMNCLIRDYGVQTHKRLEKQLNDLYFTFKFYFERKGQSDAELKAHILVATTIIHYAVDVFDSFFDTYKDSYGIDMRQDYIAARVDEAARNINQFADIIVEPYRNKLEPTENYASVCAFKAFRDKLFDDEMIDEAGMEVLKLNHLNEILEKEERKKLGLGRLKDRFKVIESRKSLCI